MQDPATNAEPAVRRVLGLLDAPPAVPDLSHGYLDLIGTAVPEPTGLAEWLMRSELVAGIYERWWRPAVSRVITGLAGPGMAGEYRLARSWLALSAGDTLIDLACGPGNFTRELAANLGRTGLAVGIDASDAMLSRAVRDTPAGAGNIAYVRADAMALPLRADCTDAVCCFAALHLMRQPFGLLDKITDMLRPGGRIALMTSCRPGFGGGRLRGTLAPASDVAGRLIGLTMFGREEITTALAKRGFIAIKQRVVGTIQFVGAQLPT